MPREGRQPQSGLGLRACAACGKEFQPYRDHQIACSRPCREQTKDKSPLRTEHTLTCECGEKFVAMWSGLGSRRPSCPNCTQRKARGKKDRMNARRRGNPQYLDRARQQNFARYGITEAEFEAMLTEQNGVCAICNNPPTPGTGPATKRLHIDHDHVTGENRGLLCLSCNNGVGRFKDDPMLLRAAADYIDSYRR